TCMKQGCQDPPGFINLSSRYGITSEKTVHTNLVAGSQPVFHTTYKTGSDQRVADSSSDVEHMFACKPSLSIRAKQEDVRSYLDQSMDELPAFGKENRDLKEEIKDTIIKAAPGSFLAAVLQFKSLAAMSSTEDVRTALVGVERNAASPHYDALYEAAMLRIESQALDQVVIAKKTLSYMLLAKCPWTFAELCHALMVKVGEPELDWDTMPSFQGIIDSCSGILVTVGSPERDEHEDVDHLHENHDNEEHAMRRLDRIETHLIHRTAHDYLERTLLMQASCDVMFKAWRWPMDWDYVGGYPEGMTELHIAAFFGISNLIRMFRPRAAPTVNEVDGWGLTALSWAAKQGHEETVEAILEFTGVDVDIRDSQGRTPISLAARQGHVAIVKMLLDHGANPNFRDFQEATPLWHAAKRGHAAIVALLIKYGVDVNVASTDYVERHTPLSLAAVNGQVEVISLLLAQQDIQPRPRITSLASYDSPCTPLGLAVHGEHPGAVEVLLSNPEIAVAARENTDGEMLLHMAVERGHEEIVRLLVSHGMNVNDQSGWGRNTPLHLAVNRLYGSHDCIIRLLLSQANLKPDLVNQYGDTPAAMAVSLGRLEVLRMLLAKGVDMEVRNNYGLTLLGLAANEGYLPMVELLLAMDGVDADSRNDEGRTPLTVATNLVRDITSNYRSECVHDHFGVVKYLLNSGQADINSRDDLGRTPLMHSARGDDHDLSSFRMILDYEGVDIDATDNEGQTALSMAVFEDKEDKAILLLEKGADPNLGRPYEGETLLCYAASEGMVKFVREFISKGWADVQARNVDGHNALCNAAKSSQLEILELLLDAGRVGINVRCGHGQTLLHHATNAVRWKEVASFLFEKGNPDLDAQDTKAMDSSSVVQRLLSTEGVDLNAEDERGWTPLFWAVQDSKASHLVGLLLIEGAGKIDINHEDRKGRTPLALALKKGYEVIVGQLRAAGAREERRNEYQDPLNNEEDHNHYGIDMTRDEVEGRGQAQQDSDGDSKSSMSGEDLRKDDFRGKSNWQRQRERTQRRRWLNPNWFDDAPADGDGDSDNGSWSGSNDGVHREEVWQSIAPQIELGIQNEAISGDECKEEDLCPQCKALDLDQVFSRGPHRGFRIEADLAAVRPRERDEDCELCAYSGTTMWLSRQKEATQKYFMSDWVDTVILGLEDKAYHDVDDPRDRMARSLRIRNAPVSSDVMSYDFISRVGSNDHQQLRSLTVHRLQSEEVDFGRARGWIDCSMDEFVALSYVWGPSARKPATMDHVRVEHAERVVEDAIRVTQALGYRYLWVDRHCITNEDEKIRKRQLLEMNAVYANAQVTIVAAAGEDSAYGLPGVSRARQQPYARVQGHSLVAVPREPADYIQNSVWWTRGWTFQEGVLSRRRLIFTEHEVSYECRGMVARECVELPERIHRIAATRYPIHEDARVFSRRGHGRGPSIWTQISEYTERHLTHDYDILNAMLGIFEVAAERKIPVYHLCGVPIIRRRFNNTDGQTLLEAFVTGLCWKVDSGTRREGFPSWSWTGWKGRAHGAKQAAISFMFGFAIEVSMIPRHDPSEALSWAEFEAMGPKEKAALPQDYMLEMTGAAFDLNIRSKHVFPPYAILYNGNAAVKGSIALYRHPKLDVGFQQRLAEERVAAIAIGDEDHPRRALVLLAVAKVGYTITNLGPLTTTYTAPAECATATENIQFIQADLPWVPAAWGYPSCVPGDYGKCIPSGDAYDKLAKEHYYTWQQEFFPYYSPGLVCPKGWTTAGEYAKSKGTPTKGMLTAQPDWNITEPAFLPLTSVWTSVLEDSETLVYCCPSGYTGDNFLNCHSIMGPITDFGYTTGCIHSWDGKKYTDATATFEGVESPYISKIKITAKPGTAYWTETVITVEETNIHVATKVPAVALVYQSSDLEKATLPGGSEKETSSSGESEKNAAAAPLSSTNISPTDAAIQTLCKECKKLGEELLDGLKVLTGRNGQGTWKSFRLALSCVWHAGRIVDLETRIEKLKNELSLRLLDSLRDHVQEGYKEQARRSVTQDKKMKEKLDDHLKAIAKLQEQLVGHIERRLAEAFQGPPENSHGTSKEGTPKSIHQRFLQGLRFEEIGERRGRIPVAMQKTFEWIYQEPDPASKYAWTSFVDWLENGEETYWITGKPGSGKSTLMKFLENDERTKRHLEKWSGDHRLITAGFYFWNSGTELQISIPGLLRSLIYLVLHEHPDLILLLCPERWEELSRFSDAEPRPWTTAELHRVFQRLSGEQFSHLRFFFLIDGLDEFIGDHEELIDLIRDLIDCEHIKVYLVTKSLLHGISSGDRVSDLQRRLDELPANLEKLFEKILDNIEPRYWEHAIQLFRIHGTHPSISALRMSFADEESEHICTNGTPEPLTLGNLARRHGIVQASYQTNFGWPYLDPQPGRSNYCILLPWALQLDLDFWVRHLLDEGHPIESREGFNSYLSFTLDPRIFTDVDGQRSSSSGIPT
ncbi:hypothetical protein CEP51_004869, partial [Fusarium floridanum]